MDIEKENKGLRRLMEDRIEELGGTELSVENGWNVFKSMHEIRALRNILKKFEEENN